MKQKNPKTIKTQTQTTKPQNIHWANRYNVVLKPQKLLIFFFPSAVDGGVQSLKFC